ncbi:hypothetical protein [Priestia megaterium]|uniref:Uncharacterized protein n=1 Tax=Priestia megaterium TaxID=1404 RepID=A0A6M6DZD7_PRIMG|nr:hypothetical protein [Priestia megaterium]QJX80253.1 hypothetical protein FDZ14_29595 [Priestia megaterium]
MAEAKKGLLLKLEELKKVFDVEHDVPEVITIDVEVKVTGAKANVVVFGEVYKNEYVRIAGFDIKNASSSIGPVKLKRITESLENTFLQKKFLLEGLELELGYIYGEHKFSETSKAVKREIVYVEKVSTEKMELLLEDVLTLAYKAVEKRTIYYFNNKLYVRTEEAITLKKEERFEQSVESCLGNLYSNSAVDKVGKFYSPIEVHDPNNIRLFISDRWNKEYDLKAKTVLYKNQAHYDKGLTLNEVVIDKEQNGIKVPKEWKNPELPFMIGDAIIYSKRLVGEPTPTFEKGSWVQVNYVGENLSDEVGKYGKVIEQKGPELIVAWEDKYEIEHSSINYRYVNKVSNPVVKLETPVFVEFKKALRYETEFIKGFGWVVEKTDNVSKVIPIRNSAPYIKCSLGHRYEINDNHHLYGEFENQFKVETNEKLNFVLVPNSQIVKQNISDDFISFMIIEEVDAVKYSAIENVLKMSKVCEQRNLMYFTDLLYFLEKTYQFDRLVKDFCEYVLALKDSYSYGSQYERKENEIEEWIFERIDITK